MEVSQRWLSFLRGEELDRVPVFPMSQGHCAKIMGAPNLGDYYTKPKFNVEAQIITREIYGYDQPPTFIEAGYGCECWGGKVRQPYNPKMGAPVPIRPACLTPEELEKVEIPDPRTAAWMPEYREMMRLSIEKNQMPYAIIPGGFITTTAPMVVPMETFMIWLMEAPDLAHKALSKTAEFGLTLVESFVEDFGTDTWYPFEATPTDSNVLIDPNMFAEYPLRYVKKLNEKIIDMGLSIWIHWCSDHTGNLKAGHVHSLPVGPEGFINMGPEVPMEVQAEKLGDKYRLSGNINPPLIMSAEFDEWQNICQKNIEDGRKAKMGYALGVGCELPPPSPPSNVYGMIKAAETYGRY